MGAPLWGVFSDALVPALDLSGDGVGATVVRTILIYAFTLFIVRVGSKRLLSEATAFDFIVGIMLGSIMSRAISGSAAFIPTLVSGAVLVGVHWLLAMLAERTDWVGSLVKGNPVLLIRDGKVNWPGMSRSLLSIRDLHEALREQGSEPDPGKV
ncbi:MAG TPA: YetF domain-containing protein, partial [Chloroflexota bacterium]|nr:YetF domain-containing protein [Chloroflexota bacterium]